MKTILLTVVVAMAYVFNSISQPTSDTSATRPVVASTTTVAATHLGLPAAATVDDSGMARLGLKSLRDTAGPIAGYHAANLLKK